MEAMSKKSMMDPNGPMWVMVIELVGAIQRHPELVRGAVQRGELQRALHEAMGAEYDANRIYDGEMDVRVHWIREVMQTARDGKPTRNTAGWPLVEFMLDQHLAYLVRGGAPTTEGRAA